MSLCCWSDRWLGCCIDDNVKQLLEAKDVITRSDWQYVQPSVSVAYKVVIIFERSTSNRPSYIKYCL